MGAFVRSGEIFGDVNGDGKPDFQIMTPAATVEATGIWL